MSVLSTFTPPARDSARDQRQAQQVREAVQRAMARPMDASGDRELVRRVSRELGTGEEVVAAQVAAIRLQTVNQIAGRMRERAIAEGVAPNMAVRVYDLAGIKAAALATRDALERARIRQRARLAARPGLAQALEEEQRHALMERFEQSDEQLARDFEEAVREMAEENAEPGERLRV